MGQERTRAWTRLGLLILCALLCAGALLWRGKQDGNQAHREEEKQPPYRRQGAEEEEPGLAGRDNSYMVEVQLGDYLGDGKLESADGTVMALKEKQGQYVALLFWASWCPYCTDELEHTESFERICENLGDVSLLLVDVWKSEKESKEAAENFLAENRITAENVYDREGEICYGRLGIQKLPMLVVLSPESRFLGAYQGSITETAVFQSVLSSMTRGYDTDTREFTGSQMENGDGGIYVSLTEEETVPSGRDVLSESQGLMMEYALTSGDKALFDRAYGYAKKNLYKEGLFLWYWEDGGDQPESNAFLDDLRIYGALLEGEKKWGGYQTEIDSLGEALCRYNTTEKGPVDFYDFGSGEKSGRFSLCYGDLQAIRELEEHTGAAGLYGKTLEIIENGYISDDFPLYFASWSYEEEEYSKESLHMAESMYTLYHLAKAGLLEDTSRQWILRQLRGNGIMARYETDGSIAEGYGYESSGIYALAAMVGIECKDGEIVSLAISRMNQMRIYESSSIYNGAFGNPDGTGIYSFDQCTALLAYARLEEWMETIRPDSGGAG